MANQEGAEQYGGQYPTNNITSEQMDALDARASTDDRLAAAYALLVHATGQGTTLRNVHDAWASWRAFSDRPDHVDLVPFELLSNETIEYDRKYRDIIRQVAAELEVTREKRGDLR